MSVRNKRSGPNGSRRPQRRDEKALRRATLEGMIYRTRWPNRVRRFQEPVSYESDPTPEQFEAHLFPERMATPLGGALDED